MLVLPASEIGDARVVPIDIEHREPVNQAYAKFENRGSAAELHKLCLACYSSPEWPSKMYLPAGQFFRHPPDDPLKDYVAVGAEGAEQLPDEPDHPKDLKADPPLE